MIKSLKRVITSFGVSKTARRVKRSGLTYLSDSKLRRLERAGSQVIKADVPGDFVEFGVALGGSAILLASRAQGAGRRFLGFDVFAMIPPPTSEKDDAKSKERYAAIRDGKSEGIGGATYYGYEENLYDKVRASFASYGVPADGQSVTLVKGLFEETWPTYRRAPIAFAHIDCDWYDPVSYCLESVAEVLSPGGLILLDDYHDYGGCKTATDEFLGAHPEFTMEDGQNVLLRRG